MTPVPLVAAAVAACLLAAATVAGLASWRGTAPPATTMVRWSPARWTGRTRQVAAAAGLAVATTAATGLLALGVAAALTVWLAPHTVATVRAERHRRDMLEATRMWLLHLQAVLAAGRGLRQAMAEVADQQPADSVLSGPLRRLSIRMDRLGEVPALQAFAVEVDNQVGDAAVTVLIAALRYQNVEVAAALAALVPWAEQDVAQLRDRDVKLRGLRTERWIMLGMVTLMAGYFTFTAPWLMDAYTTPVGQVVLTGLLAAGGFLVWLIGWMSRLQGPPRWFAHDGDR